MDAEMDLVRTRVVAVVVVFLAFGASLSLVDAPGTGRNGVEPSAAALHLASDGPANASPMPEPSAGHASAAPSERTKSASTVGAAASAVPHPAGEPSPSPQPTQRPTPRRTPRSTAKPSPKPTSNPPPTWACPLFPSTNVWNKRVDGLAVAANSATLVATIGADAHLHPDFGSYAGYGIPYNVVGSGTARVHVSFDYADESDVGPYPIPSNPRIESGSDRHLLMWDTAACRLYELFAAVKTTSGWHAGSGAIWDLRSNALRPDGWTSADAAGLPILPGLVRYDEVAAGLIAHAIRFTAPSTRSAHIHPARHDAGDGSSPSLPAMGTRLRLKATFNIGGFSPRMRVILTAMKRYGIILADNGSPWFFSGASDPHWNDDELNQLKSLTGSDFEVVNTAGFVNG